MTAVSIITSYLKKNPCYIANEEFTPKGIMVSMVGCPQPSAKVFINNWNRESYTKACPHVLVDANDGKIYQTLPYCVRGRFAEADLNDQYISVLLCEPSQIKYSSGEHFNLVGDKDKALAAVERAYRSCVEACGTICRMFNFDPMTQIHSPAEGVNNPKEPNAFWRFFTPYTMESMKLLVRASVCSDDQGEASTPDATFGHAVAEDVPSEPAPVTISVDCATGPDYTVVNGEIIPNPIIPVAEPAESEIINIQIDVPNLRIRKGPGAGPGCEPIGRYTGVGRFQITEIQNGSGSEKGWGKLATGEGWISMDYVTVL